MPVTHGCHSGSLALSGKLIAKLFSGEIPTWKALALELVRSKISSNTSELVEVLSSIDAPIELVGRSDDSEDTHILTGLLQGFEQAFSFYQNRTVEDTVRTVSGVAVHTRCRSASCGASKRQ